MPCRIERYERPKVQNVAIIVGMAASTIHPLKFDKDKGD
jgi:hypothetical protein